MFEKKQAFEAPVCEIVRFSVEDVITNSGWDGGDAEGGSGNGGSGNWTDEF